MALFLDLYLGHIVGDFVFQPGRLVLAKRRRHSALLLHVGIVTLCTAAVVLEALPRLWPAVLMAGIVHYAVEQLTVHARRTPDSSSLAVFLLDQGLHVVALGIIAMLPGARAEALLVLWPVPLLLLAGVCAVATVAFAGSILIFEVELSRLHHHGPTPVLALDAPRIYGIVERGGALVAGLLLPVPPLALAAFLPRVAYAFAVKKHKRHNLTAAAIGLLACVVAWALMAPLIPAQ